MDISSGTHLDEVLDGIHRFHKRGYLAWDLDGECFLYANRPIQPHWKREWLGVVRDHYLELEDVLPEEFRLTYHFNINSKGDMTLLQSYILL